jgi:hypothetical protein
MRSLFGPFDQHTLRSFLLDRSCKYRVLPFLTQYNFIFLSMPIYFDVLQLYTDGVSFQHDMRRLA